MRNILIHLACLGIAICLALFVTGQINKLAYGHVTTPASPYPLESIVTPTKTYHCEVIIPVAKLIKQYGDDTRIMRYVDEDAGVVIYFTVNDTGELVTSMHPIPIGNLSIYRNLYKRYAK
ncbi:MAG: hypothetical protein PVI03_05890 [Candidatus Thorarchaeota archaeon]|jgi:hypothetical protein